MANIVQREPPPTEKGPAIDAEVDPITYNPSDEAIAIAEEVIEHLGGNGTESRKIKRTDSCDVAEPIGNGPKPPVDTVEAFLAYAPFRVGRHLKFDLTMPLTGSAATFDRCSDSCGICAIVC